MPIAPLVRLEQLIQDHPSTPYLFESFLNVGEEDQAGILTQLTNQDRLYLDFHGDDFSHRFTKIVQHDEQQRCQLNELVRHAVEYWGQIPVEQRGFDQAKAAFMQWFV